MENIVPSICITPHTEHHCASYFTSHLFYLYLNLLTVIITHNRFGKQLML